MFREQPGGPQRIWRTREASLGGCAHPETDVFQRLPGPALPRGGPSVKGRVARAHWSLVSMQGHCGGAAVLPPGREGPPEVPVSVPGTQPWAQPVNTQNAALCVCLTSRSSHPSLGQGLGGRFGQLSLKMLIYPRDYCPSERKR